MTTPHSSRWLRTNAVAAEAAGRLSPRPSPCRSATSAARSSGCSRDLACAYSDGTVRVTAVQNLVFSWVRRDDVAALFRSLQAAGLGLPDADSIADVTSCPGAESCKLAVTQSRGLGQAVEQHLRSTPALIDMARDARHQGQRLSERVRTASHRGDWLSGQPAKSGRPCGAAVLHPGRRRHRCRAHDVRPAGREGAGAPGAAGARAAGAALRRREGRMMKRRWRSSAGSRSRA